MPVVQVAASARSSVAPNMQLFSPSRVTRHARGRRRGPTAAPSGRTAPDGGSPGPRRRTRRSAATDGCGETRFGLARTPSGCHGTTPPCGHRICPTPACFLARRTSLMKLSRRPRLPMHHIRMSNSLVAAHGGLSGISVWLVPKRTLRNRAFCLRVALPTDRRPAESQAVPTAWRRVVPFILPS
jgi:hypothetical protein